jgi:hypothetical protein
MRNLESESTWTDEERDAFFAPFPELKAYQEQMMEDESLESALQDAIAMYGEKDVQVCLSASIEAELPLIKVLDHLLNGEGKLED